VRGKHNCTEVALEAGFEDPNYFARVFRRVYGHPPSDLLWAGEKWAFAKRSPETGLKRAISGTATAIERAAPRWPRLNDRGT
jgi:AraC-like DNA-binding protein